jgi:hypothetical protein
MWKKKSVVSHLKSLFRNLSLETEENTRACLAESRTSYLQNTSQRRHHLNQYSQWNCSRLVACYISFLGWGLRGGNAPCIILALRFCWMDMLTSRTSQCQVTQSMKPLECNVSMTFLIFDQLVSFASQDLSHIKLSSCFASFYFLPCGSAVQFSRGLKPQSYTGTYSTKRIF